MFGTHINHKEVWYFKFISIIELITGVTQNMNLFHFITTNNEQVTAIHIYQKVFPKSFCFFFPGSYFRIGKAIQTNK